MRSIYVLLVLIVGLALVLAPGANAQTIAGNYAVTVTGTNNHLDITPATQPISATTTMNITQTGDKINVTFGTFAGAFSATLFKGKVGNNLFSAIWWSQGSPDEANVVWGKVVPNENKLTGSLIYPRVSARSDPPPGSPRMVPGYVYVDFEAVKLVKMFSAKDPNESGILDGKDFALMRVQVNANANKLTGSLIYPRVSARSDPPPGSPRLVPGYVYVDFEAVKGGDAVRVDIITYANWAFMPFQSLYFTGGEYGQVHVMMMADRFTVLGQAPGQPGLFNVPLFEGPAIRTDPTTYGMEFPWSAAFGRSTQVEAWVFSQDGGDRLPDAQGKLTVTK